MSLLMTKHSVLKLLIVSNRLEIYKVRYNKEQCIDKEMISKFFNSNIYSNFKFETINNINS